MLTSMFKSGPANANGPHASDIKVALEAAHIPSFRRSIHEARRELRRCRRYEHPLGILVLGMDGDSLHRVALREAVESEMDERLARRFECTALLMLGWLLRDGSRESDLVSYAAEHHAYALVLPETDGIGAHATVRRLSESFERRTSVALRAGYAVFPDDGLTIDDLYATASRPWRVRSTARAPRRPRLRDVLAPAAVAHADEVLRSASHG